MKKVLVFLFVSVLAVTGSYAGGDKDKDKKQVTAPAKNVPEKKSTLDIREQIKRRGVCESFELKYNESVQAIKLTAVDTSVIPDWFPAPPPGAQLCGCHRFLNTAYYLSAIPETELFKYYRKALKEAGFMPEDPKAANVPKQTFMAFTGDAGNGHIYYYGDKGGFGVLFKDKKPCKCEKKSAGIK